MATQEPLMARLQTLAPKVPQTVAQAATAPPMMEKMNRRTRARRVRTARRLLVPRAPPIVRLIGLRTDCMQLLHSSGPRLAGRRRQSISRTVLVVVEGGRSRG